MPTRAPPFFVELANTLSSRVSCIATSSELRTVSTRMAVREAWRAWAHAIFRAAKVELRFSRL